MCPVLRGPQSAQGTLARCWRSHQSQGCHCLWSPESVPSRAQILSTSCGIGNLCFGPNFKRTVFYDTICVPELSVLRRQVDAGRCRGAARVEPLPPDCVCGVAWWHCMGTGGGSAYAHDCVLHRWAMGRLHAVRWCCPRSSGGPVPASAASWNLSQPGSGRALAAEALPQLGWQEKAAATCRFLKFYFYCGKIHIIKLTIFVILSVQFSGIKHRHSVV